MDKIQALLTKAGVKPELATKICESLNNYRTTLREQFETDYAAKVEQAKKVCIDETEAHKREISRRLGIFCETKAAAIEATLAKTSALNESEALTKLTNIAGLVSGLEPNGGSNGAATAVIEKLKQKAQVANEEKKKAITLANRKTAIAEKALKQNRTLTTENTQLKRRTGKPVTENRRQSKRRRIDDGRKGGKPQSTRATLTENQDRRSPAPSNQPNTRTADGNTDYSVGGIANRMDEDLI